LKDPRIAHRRVDRTGDDQTDQHRDRLDAESGHLRADRICATAEWALLDGAVPAALQTTVPSTSCSNWRTGPQAGWGMWAWRWVPV
jgi:hypothetical protein